MRKSFLIIMLCAISAVSALGQKVISDPNVQKREVSGYHGIAVSNGIEVILTQGATEAVAVSALTAEDRDKITTIVENGVLKISYDYNLWKVWKSTGNKKLRAYVSVVNIDKVNVSGGARITLDGSLKSIDMNMNATSGGSFDGMVDAATMEIHQSSGSRITLSGAVKQLNYTANSGSRLMGFGLAVNTCDANTSSGAKMEITVNGELSAHVSSGGNIQYKGNGVIRTIRSSSGGNVSRG